MFYFIRFSLKLTMLLMVYSAIVLAITIPYGWLAFGAAGFFMVCKKTYRHTAYGTARWADASDIPHMLEGKGLIVGHIEGKLSRPAAVKALFNRRMTSKQACQKFFTAFQRKQPKQLVRLTRAVHTAVFAPTGVGKGVSIVIPHLLTCTDSMVVLDFKGENYKITADARRKMGHRVICLDPFGLVGGKDSFNPLDQIPKDDPLAWDRCRALADSLVISTGDEKDPHWVESAKIWVAALIGVVEYYAEPADRSLQTVRKLLSDPKKIAGAIELMCSSDAWGGMLSRVGHQLTHYKDKELNSTLTSTLRFLYFLDTQAVAANTSQSTFNPRDLTSDKKHTVFLVLPPEFIRSQVSLLRMWVGAMLQAVVAGGLQETRLVHFVLDEAASLHRLDVLDDALDKYRGYSVRLILLYQSLGQLKKCWGTDGGDQTLLSNTTQLFFGVSDPLTSQFVSDRLGDETIIVASGGRSWGTSSQSSQQGSNSTSYSTNTNDNWQQVGRKLLKPEEVAGLHERVCITFAPGVPPMWTWLCRYYEGDFNISQGVGLVKAVFDATCFFLTAAVLAVGCTMAFINLIPR